MEAAFAPVESLRDAPFTRRERAIVDALVSAYPREQTMMSLIEACYGDDPNGGPGSADSTVRRFVSRIRSKLPLYGWNIPYRKKTGGNYNFYRLEPLIRSKAA